MKQALLSLSANALRSCVMSDCTELSFVKIHSMSKKCTPMQIMSYQAIIHLHKFSQKSLRDAQLSMLYFKIILFAPEDSLNLKYLKAIVAKLELIPFQTSFITFQSNSDLVL